MADDNQNNNSQDNSVQNSNTSQSTINGQSFQSDYTVSEGGWVSVDTSTSSNRASLEIQKGNTESWLKK